MPLFSTLCPSLHTILLSTSSAALASLLTYIYFNPPSSLPTFRFKILLWDTSLTPTNKPTFTLTRNVSPWGTGPETQITHHILLPSEECEAKLARNQASHEVRRKGNPVVRVETNSLAANDKCEDEMSIDLLTSSDLPHLRKGEEGKGFWEYWGKLRNKLSIGLVANEGDEKEKSDGSEDMMLLSVLDGHGGGQTSSLLRKVLHGTICWGLGGLREWTNQGVYQRIIDVYKALDTDICRSGLSIAQAPCPDCAEDKVLPTPNPSLLSLIPNAGSTACTALLDIKNERLYLINIGDARAVPGWYNEREGKWRVDTLSQDQECGNPDEVERLKANHFDQENVVLDEGFTPRLLGNMQPSRAFGDDGLKLTKSEKESIELAGQVKFVADESPFTKKTVPYIDPPYMDAEPEIVIRKLRENQDEKLKFLVIATDGLWDKISSEEAILLLSAHYTHPKHAPIPKTKLPSLFPQFEPDTLRPRSYPAEDLPGTTADNSKGCWLFEDDNAATHLVRNGLDGDGDKKVQEMILSLSGNGTRSVRDDTSVM
ncbi:hypothetical protein I302_106599 [Kwoniella bestiolae CBS 10118]|uniref:PPM-type phosphatase domain-containing protein n=1 Tax=Kwoniella bestiolae CBS 10118 TaxID=1296100 RepID=A0A1B9G0Y8_9TREE|nr:hypothetical protein I302_06139 [Kwoniella bestiolae CBS 10118]OCF24678.1 hypothetical protein I302_06139 [Kwoniella bestiolae CBS 10118]